MRMDFEMKIDGKFGTEMKQIASIFVFGVLVVAWPLGVTAQGNPWNNTAQNTQTQFAPTAPTASPFAPADLEQQLSSGRMRAAETPPEYVAPRADAGPQFVPLEQAIPAPQYGQRPPQQFMQQQQFAPMQQFMGQQPYYGNAPSGNFGNYGGYVPNYAYGGYPNGGGFPGAYGGYPFPNGYNSIPNGYGTQAPFSNGFNGFPFNSGEFGNQYGNIPIGSSPFFGGGNSPFGFW